jgi:hypothetical protein
MRSNDTSGAQQTVFNQMAKFADTNDPAAWSAAQSLLQIGTGDKNISTGDQWMTLHARIGGGSVHEMKLSVDGQETMSPGWGNGWVAPSPLSTGIKTAYDDIKDGVKKIF